MSLTTPVSKMKVLRTLDSLPARDRADVVVIGAGGAGMATALFAALEGRRVLLVERTAHVGGTTALSAGTTWIPGTRLGATVNPDDSLAEAARFLDAAVGERTAPGLRQVFLDNGAAAVEALAARTDRSRPVRASTRSSDPSNEPRSRRSGHAPSCTPATKTRRHVRPAAACGVRTATRSRSAPRATIRSAATSCADR